MSNIVGSIQTTTTEGSVVAMATIEGSVAAMATIEGSVAASAVLGGVEIGGIIVNEILLPPYDGAYAITPADEAQTLATADKRMTGDIVVAAIPSNYGLISWDGSRLTVS